MEIDQVPPAPPAPPFKQQGEGNIAIGEEATRPGQTGNGNIAIGFVAGGDGVVGSTSGQEYTCIAIGSYSGQGGQSGTSEAINSGPIAIGQQAGACLAGKQHAGCVAIGDRAANDNQYAPEGSIIINAHDGFSAITHVWTDGGKSGCFIAPIRPEPPTAASAGVYYDTGTKELRHSTTKTFTIPHPTVEGKMLRHACIEAPTRGTNLYEYQINVETDNASTVISLPEYFSSLNRRHRVYVYPENTLSRCCGSVNDAGTHAIIQTEKAGIFNVMITGVRKDIGAVQYSATEYIDDPIDLKDIPRTETVILERSGPSVT